MRKLHILRGLPGSGKSRRALQLAADAGMEDFVICSADHYFESTGSYRFDPQQLGAAHAESLGLAVSHMSQGLGRVIIDNTNSRHWEFAVYLQVAKGFGYTVTVETVGNLTDVELYAARNTHGVPVEVIRQMADRWEK